jgi:hypothetical protein
VRVFVVLCLFVASAAADAPKGYKCGPGGYRVKDTCRCPDDKRPARDAVGHAICEPKPEPVATACLADRKGKHAVKITTVPAGATLYLGARSCGPVAQTPWTGKLAAGPVEVILEHQGYDTMTRLVTVSPTSTAELYVPMQRTMMGAIDIKGDADPNVAGVPVVVDGQPAGTVPTTLKLRAGRHLVEIKKPGFDPFSQWVEIQDAQTLVLMPQLRAIVVAKARLVIDADLPQAEVLVDGVRRGTTPLALDDLPLGDHVVEVRKPPARPWTKTVTLAAGTSMVRAELAATIPRAPTDGELIVQSVPAGAEVWLDGNQVGKTPWKSQVPGGDHWLQLKLVGHVTYEKKLALEAGKTEKLAVQLTAAGELMVTSVPAGSTVFVDGVRRGLTPLSLVLPAGDHVVIVERAGYQRFEHKVKLGERRVEIHAPLKR